MRSSRIGRLSSRVGLTAQEPMASLADDQGRAPNRTSSNCQTARLVFLAGWATLAVAAFFYLQISATGEDGLGGYLPLVTAGLIFSTGSLFTLLALAQAESGA